MPLDRLVRHCLLVAGTALITAPAIAQEYPTKPVRIIVPYPGGSGPDIVARTLAGVMTRQLGQNVLVENKGGGGGVPAILDLKNAPQDGHTILLPDSSQWAVFPSLRTDLPYEPARDFAPIGMLYSNGLYFYVKSDSPLKSITDVVARAKEKPGSLRYGVTGVGGIMHIAGEAWRLAAGINVTVVPYRASAEALASVLSGDLDFALTGLSSIKAVIQGGKIKTLASTGPKRDRYTPDVPSVNEIPGIRGFDYQADIGLVAWTGTPRPIIDKLSRTLHAAQKDAVLLDFLKSLDYDAVVTTPEEFGAKMRSDLEKFRATVKAANIRIQ